MKNRTTVELPDRWDPEPRWPAWIAVLTVAGLHTALPSHLMIGPRWLCLLVILALLVPTAVTHLRESLLLNRVIGFTVTSEVTVGLILSVLLPVDAVPAPMESPSQLLL